MWTTGDAHGHAKIRGWHALAILVATVVPGALTACASKHEMSDDEWCKSFEYRPGTPAYQEFRELDNGLCRPSEQPGH
jgi:hypothetical protein